MLKRIVQTSNLKSILLIRLMVGVVFLSEGIQKFLFPMIRGAGRFEKIGLPSPEFLGFFVGGFEIVCGYFDWSVHAFVQYSFALHYAGGYFHNQSRSIVERWLLDDDACSPNRLCHVVGEHFSFHKRGRAVVA